MKQQYQNIREKKYSQFNTLMGVSLPNFQPIQCTHKLRPTYFQPNKGQLISNQFSFEPKNQRKYFCISALASKMSQLKKIMSHYHAN